MVEHREVQLIRPPVFVCPRPSPLGSRGRDYRVLAFADAHSVFLIRHVDPSPFRVFSSADWFLSTMSWRGYELVVFRWNELRPLDLRHVAAARRPAEAESVCGLEPCALACRPGNRGSRIHPPS